MQKVAILGGGLGALSAAYWLTESPNWQQRYQITVYQQGWRLGGKGASGRNMRHGYGRRIEEHGLHLWFGSYENAFRMYRQILGQLNALPHPPVKTYSTWRQAFRPHSMVVLGDNGPDGLEQWPILFPGNDREPGKGERPNALEMFVEALRMGVNFFEGRFGDEDEVADFFEGFGLPDIGTAAIWSLQRHAWRAVIKAAGRLGEKLSADSLSADVGLDRVLAELLTAFRFAVRTALGDGVPQNLRARRIWVTTDLLTTTAIGVLRDGLLREGFEKVDDQEFRGWLRSHGADPVITLDSNITRVVYDLMFAYEQGDQHRPNVAAGTGAMVLLYVVAGYDGAFMYKMQSGMGDTIFTPMYGLLKSRGIQFEFFHRVEEIVPAANGDIQQIKCTRQVNLKANVIAAGGYDPLLEVKGKDCWPAEPLFDQIENADQLQNDPDHPGRPYNLESAWSAWPGVGSRVLQRGVDFDLVVCGIPPEVMKRVASALIARSTKWKNALEGAARVQTTRTHAVQVWFRRTHDELGWVEPERMRAAAMEGRANPLLGGYLQSLNTWCDMTQVLPTEEAWGAAGEARSVSYFCGQMPDDPNQPDRGAHDYPARQIQVVRDIAKNWLAQVAPVLFPEAIDATSPIGIRLDVLLSTPGAAPLSDQYYRANIDDAERYTLSVAGSTARRLMPHDAAFANLYLAGDWIRNPFLNAGCVESSVASGMAAARAVSGYPQDIAGETEQTRALFLKHLS